jgi:hypothetical protein
LSRAVEQSELKQIAEIRQQIRHELHKRGLVKRALDMCEGRGKFHKLGLHFQHQIFIELWDRAIGRPAALNLAIVNAGGEQSVQLIKRIVGIQEDEL